MVNIYEALNTIKGSKKIWLFIIIPAHKHTQTLHQPNVKINKFFDFYLFNFASIFEFFSTHLVCRDESEGERNRDRTLNIYMSLNGDFTSFSSETILS